MSRIIRKSIFCLVAFFILFQTKASPTHLIPTIKIDKALVSLEKPNQANIGDINLQKNDLLLSVKYARNSKVDSILLQNKRTLEALELAKKEAQIKTTQILTFTICIVGIIAVTLALIASQYYKKKEKAYRIIQLQKKEVETQRDKIRKQNTELEATNKKISDFNSNLEEIVSQRTSDLNRTLQKLNQHQFNLAHKIRVPIASLLGIVNLVQKESLSSKDNKAVFAMLQQSAKKIDEIIHDLTNELHEELKFEPQQTPEPASKKKHQQKE